MDENEFNIGSHCSLGETAWTNLFSNQTQLSGFDSQNDTIPLFSECRLPDKCVSSFLHESIHNICFQSPVGFSAAYLHFTTLLDMIGRTDPSARVRANWLRTTTLYTVMRPLAEGLALFCEFDVAPRPSDDNWSNPMWWLYFFTKPLNSDEVNSPGTFGNALYKRLMILRSSKEFVRHKQSLLLHPFDNRRGGYLSGYMTVKRLWYWSAIHCDKFSNRDFFLRYLINYFYCDPGLVYAIHSEDISVTGAVNSILGAFQLRLREFFSLNFEEEAEKMIAFDSAAAASPKSVMLYELGIANDEWPLAREALDRMVSRISIMNPTCDAEHLLRLAGWYMAQRELLCLAQLTVVVRKTEENRFDILLNGERLGESVYRVGTEGREGAANFTCYISVVHKRIIHCVTQGLVVLSLRVFELAPSAVPASQIDHYFFLDFQELKNLNDGLSIIYRSYVEQRAPADAIPTLMKFVDETVSGVYAQCALYELDALKFKTVYEDMKSSGFLGLLGGTELVGALAAITVGASMRSTIDDVLNVFEKIQPSLRDQLPKLKSAAEAAGFTFYEQQPSLILSFV